MTRTVVISYKPTFLRQYWKLPEELRLEVKESIGRFTEDPHHPSLRTHKLKGKLDGFFSFSVNYQYRVVFEYESKGSVILVAVGDHDVYR